MTKLDLSQIRPIPDFDSLQWKRERQAQILQETEGMSDEEVCAYFRRACDRAALRRQALAEQQAAATRRTGAALIVCIVLLTVLATLTGLLVKNVLDDRRETRLELIKSQVQILMQDGQHRAELQREAKPEFSGETLKIKSEKTNPAGTIRLTSLYNEETKTFDVNADFIDRNDKVLIVK